ncbi:glycosyltransferase [filamentous cyanobacterium LEGE 11480]|uniref:Glycosyltransferase n=1 Tax=Romeriopsis navalis LEGE 11480 TaxID=2777977 RepID=A0A928Z3R5_9CYAN|nr:glycosyltransferase family 2 protein [Romeriopsis navalis]MBE9030964.1 glycosyltransferase [Romeriopsis navalis LEGE 11480]
MARVSVIIPTYNAEKFIAKTIRSVLNQTYQDFEILIIDDESPDGSVAVCKQFRDDRIRIISQKNRGLPGARNTGIRAAQGEFISFVDADDLWLPEKLAAHVKQLDSRPEVGISFSCSAFIDDDDVRTGLLQKPTRLENITPDYVLCRNPIGNGSAAVLRRQVFDEIAFEDDKHGPVETCYFDERVNHHSADATDVECWLRISIQTDWVMAGIDQPLTLYRIHTGGLSANVMRQLESLEAVIEKTRGYAPAVIARCEHKAKAYHLRYIARRAVTLRDGSLAVSMMNRALGSDWRIALEEPKKTVMTVGAAYLLRLLPKHLYLKMEDLAMQSLLESSSETSAAPKVPPATANPFTQNLPSSEVPSQPL